MTVMASIPMTLLATTLSMTELTLPMATNRIWTGSRLKKSFEIIFESVFNPAETCVMFLLPHLHLDHSLFLETQL